MRRRNYETIATLLLIYLIPIDTQTVAASPSSTWWTHFIYMFFHANIFHLAGNLYALWFISPSKKQLIISYLLAVLSSLGSLSPIIGFSAIIYSLWGMNMSHASHKAWLIFLIVSIVTLFLPGISWIAHTVSFTIGLIYAYFNQLNHEYRRACKGR